MESEFKTCKYCEDTICRQYPNNTVAVIKIKDQSYKLLKGVTLDDCPEKQLQDLKKEREK